jgi:uncharacterized protein YwgA
MIIVWNADQLSRRFGVGTMSVMRSRGQIAWDRLAVMVLARFAQHDFRPVDNLKIQKLMFLAEFEGLQARVATAHYRFFRYKFGPFSTQLADDVRTLEEFGLIEVETRELTKRGTSLIQYVWPEVRQDRRAFVAVKTIIRTCHKYRHLKSSDLADLVGGMSIPVLAYSSRAAIVGELPMFTDILDPAEEAEPTMPFPVDILADVEEELTISPEQLDPASERFRGEVSVLLNRALQRERLV